MSFSSVCESNPHPLHILICHKIHGVPLREIHCTGPMRLRLSPWLKHSLFVSDHVTCLLKLKCYHTETVIGFLDLWLYPNSGFAALKAAF